MRGNDHLLRRVLVRVPMLGALSPAWMAHVHLETASVERREIVNLVQFMNLGSKLFRQVQVVRRQLVLGVAATADVAVSTGDAAGSPRSHAAEVRVLGFYARAPEVHAHRRLVESLLSPDLGRGLLQRPIDVGG